MRTILHLKGRFTCVVHNVKYKSSFKKKKFYEHWGIFKEI
jgi:hypothetical protein